MKPQKGISTCSHPHMYQSIWICPYILPSLFLTVDELSMLLYKVNDSGCALNPVPSLLLNDSVSAISSYLCFTMKLSVLCIPIKIQSLFLCNAKFLGKITITHCLCFLSSKLYWTSLNYPQHSSKATLVKVTNDLQIAKSNNQFSVLIGHSCFAAFGTADLQLFGKCLLYLAAETLFSFDSPTISLLHPS